MDQVKKIKTECLGRPQEKLWNTTKNVEEVRLIYEHIQSLRYEDKPNYGYLKGLLVRIYMKYQPVFEYEKQIYVFDNDQYIEGAKLLYF
mmetsp:Transcript_39389/g.60211  ORF Transcript_39389/g.60211 Transcript_39389/m.60211 type:complete len:89 (+) Transcript_39389:2425-2691(+)|eukprot:CAMPEP_0170482048 /NCGR_PEP_ID=MMETSP0208-20121228/2240_1 /TAXON_ID=197538 /ORGANISM="Strombidium inclinatum, Strain S3" /LENGTH=88 /DNA_ID=CAMNT_0010754843 /DNA_START=2425 /DNA_END=2691 /DNA_ORIENTATION=-